MKAPLIFLALATAGSHAATVVIIDSTGLTPVNQANLATGTASNLATGAAWTFTTGVLGTDNLLSSIGLEGRQSGQGAQVLTLELWSNPANNSGTLDIANAVLLATSTNSSALTVNTVSDYLFSGVTLANNTVYSVHVVGTTPGFGLVGTTTTDLVPNSRLFQNGAFVFGGTAPNGIDSSFRVVTVPEPASALLGSIGVLALLCRRRA
jgi:hypothetical protein